jgi:CHASE2 domain-containing sensor protein
MILSRLHRIPTWVAIPLLATFCALGSVVVTNLELPIATSLKDDLGDMPQAMFGSQASTQRHDITLVLIDDDTLREYPTVTPISRSLLACVIMEISLTNPKVIGVDAIIERRTHDEEMLVNAIRTADVPIVFGTIDDRAADYTLSKTSLREQIQSQEAFLLASGAIAGHVWFESNIDRLASNSDAVRMIASSFVGKPARESFSAAVASAAGAEPNLSRRTISWLKAPDAATPLFAQLRVPRHSPLPDCSGALLSPLTAPLLRHRIVLIGLDLPDRDQHLTPLSLIDGAKTPGVLIHAQAIAQHLDGDRYIKVFNLFEVFSMSLVAAFLVEFLRRLWRRIEDLQHKNCLYRFAIHNTKLATAFISLAATFLIMSPAVVLNIDLPVTAIVASWTSMLILAAFLFPFPQPDMSSSATDQAPAPASEASS